MNNLKTSFVLSSVAIVLIAFNPAASFGFSVQEQATQRKLVSSPHSYTPSAQPQLAFNLPNFQPEASVENGALQVRVPISLFEGPINDILRANEGRYKDTDFQKMDVSSMRVSFTNGGFAVNGNWRFQAREYLGKFFGKKKYTPWVSVSGSFTQGFNLSVQNGILVAQAGKTDVRGANKWYGDILNALVSKLGVNGTVNRQVNAGLQRINGMNVQQLLVQAGSAQVAQALGISQNDATQLINSRVGGINANISDGRLLLSVKVQ